jgi:predicted butyrate kinase (DUF1464 family)
MILPSLLRHSLSAAGGAMVATGMATGTDSQLLEVLGAVATIISFIWSLWSKKP